MTECVGLVVTVQRKMQFLTTAAASDATGNAPARAKAAAASSGEPCKSVAHVTNNPQHGVCNVMAKPK